MTQASKLTFIPSKTVSPASTEQLGLVVPAVQAAAKAQPSPSLSSKSRPVIKLVEVVSVMVTVTVSVTGEFALTPLANLEFKLSAVFTEVAPDAPGSRACNVTVTSLLPPA